MTRREGVPEGPAAPPSRAPAPRCRIAILGGGPVGIEAALYARALGHQVTVYEEGEVGENVKRWGFVRLFSPWSLDVSPLGLSVLREGGAPVPPPTGFATGEEFRQRYLLPLGAALGGSVRSGWRVEAVGRCGTLKGDLPGSPERARKPFRLLLRRPDGSEDVASAEVVIDASGVYGQPAWLGDGGIPAPGEREAAAAIEYHLPDLSGRDRERFAGKRVLLAGSGYSAATALAWLRELVRDSATAVVWARRDRRPRPFLEIPRDPLPERFRLAREGNELAASPPRGFRVLSGVAASRIEPRGEAVRVTLKETAGGGEMIVEADRILALVGYRPDLEVLRELQVHLCYATEGPMRLAASLLGTSGGDCLGQGGFGPEALVLPEPGLYIAGHKSYGRRSDFLLRAGREQIRDIFRSIEKDPDLDLYRPAGAPAAR